MSQAIGRLDTAIEEVGAALCHAATQKHLACSKLAEQKRRHAQLVEELNANIKKGCERLAKAAIKQQLHAETQMALLEKSIASIAKEEKETATHLIALKTKKQKMEEMLRQFVCARTEKHPR